MNKIIIVRPEGEEDTMKMGFDLTAFCVGDRVRLAWSYDTPEKRLNIKFDPEHGADATRPKSLEARRDIYDNRIWTSIGKIVRVGRTNLKVSWDDGRAPADMPLRSASFRRKTGLAVPSLNPVFCIVPLVTNESIRKVTWEEVEPAIYS